MRAAKRTPCMLNMKELLAKLKDSINIPNPAIVHKKNTKKNAPKAPPRINTTRRHTIPFPVFSFLAINGSATWLSRTCSWNSSILSKYGSVLVCLSLLLYIDSVRRSSRLCYLLYIACTLVARRVEHVLYYTSTRGKARRENGVRILHP